MLPKEFTERMEQLLGGESKAFFSALEEERYQALRVNPLKTEKEDFLKKAPFSLSPVPWADGGYYYESADRPGKHPFHEAGVYYIQEPSAMAPVSFLGAEPGERILDLCAAPGGKSGQIAAAMKGEGLLVCNEIHPARAKILSENIERLGVSNALVTNETPDHLAERFPGFFDRILVDAPCSGEGMFRKNEEACGEWSPENVKLCADRQDAILDCAWQMLRPGGILVYSTCTFAPAENEGSISRLLKRHPDMYVKKKELPEEFCPGRPDWVENPAEGIENTCRLWPHRIRGEGHFMAVLKKEGGLEAEVSDGGASVCRRQTRMSGEKGIPEKNCALYLEFAAQYLCEKKEGIYLQFGDQLYLAPFGTPSLKGLKVLRPGLHLGTVKKNRFEPSHALALALHPGEAVYSCSFAADSRQIAAYLGGEAFPVEGEKGWYLICVDGYSTGWGKLSGGMMKNHYPRGLRKNWDWRG